MLVRFYEFPSLLGPFPRTQLYLDEIRETVSDDVLQQVPQSTLPAYTVD